ncbi:sensor histidine kinase [Propylenella binzhouense]|uniref:histidine kinase n=1 Tax=Propylenella binzhouense TaxID=2555902 RepID=A0A964T7T0_9HYPH|nr:PAS domain-containing sensor histidine kinase [Propylenella binzhouense]MYZ48942.1 histidine kinase [Propylenella binzhouense]
MKFEQATPNSSGPSADAEAAGLGRRFEAALTGSQITICSQDLDGGFTWVFNPPEGVDPDAIVGKGEGDGLFAPAADVLGPARSAVIATGEPRELEIRTSDLHGPHWYDVRIMPQRDRAGEVVGTILSAVDVTERKIHEEHLRIVLRELAHRSKNLLAVIQGIARQTAESTNSTQQFVSRFNGRIYSLSRAHDVLTDADWRGARIFDLVRSQVALYAEPRLSSIQLEGENGFLRPNAAQYLGLALHELTTNAIKYGALSVPDGTIAVRFERSPRDSSIYRFLWEESSTAPLPARAPRGRSFGLLMLDNVVPTSVSGTAELSFGARGLRYQLEIPKAQLVP